MPSDGAFSGCIYENGGASFKEFCVVTFASKSLGADLADNSLMGGWMRRGSLAPSSSDGDYDEDGSSDE